MTILYFPIPQNSLCLTPKFFAQQALKEDNRVFHYFLLLNLSIYNYLLSYKVLVWIF